MRRKKPISRLEQKSRRRKNKITLFRKKGFVQIVEVAVAALLIVLALPAFFSWLNVKQDWSRHDLTVAGSGIIHSLEAGGNMSQIYNNTQEILREIDSVRPSNVRYSIYSEGAPKPKISVACISCTDAQLLYAKNIFTPAFFDGRFITFTVDRVNMSLLPSIPVNYDVSVFIYFSDADWTAQKQNITNYLSSGKGIIAIQPATNGGDFLGIFNLSNAGGAASYQNFTSYYPARSDIEMYFLAFGFDVATADDGTGNYAGTWFIWENQININTTGASVQIDGVGTKAEGETFSLNGPDLNLHSFKVKKILADKSGVIFQTLDKNFAFKDFWNPGENKVEGNNILTGDQAVTYSLMTKNNTAIWISDSAYSDEYKALIKSAAASLSESYYIVSPMNAKDTAVVNYFTTLCCDAVGTAKLTFAFWYVF